jgi:SAM-dependent methyltransferase
LPAGDPNLPDIIAGGSAPSPGFENVVGAATAWHDPDHAAWMDFLDSEAPNHREKLLERALYLHHWAPWLPGEGRVLDLGGGTGRFMAAMLDRGLDVELVDPDLRSLWRAAQHAKGRPGRLDLHWTTGLHLPDIPPVDLVLAVEVLCYVDDPRAVLQNIRRVLAPGGVLMASVEARWGWAASLDVPPGVLEALVTDGVVHVPGDRWVRTYDHDALLSLFEGWELLFCLRTHYTTSGPFELAAGELNLAQALVWEERLRNHPQIRNWNRAWTVVARPITTPG